MATFYISSLVAMSTVGTVDTPGDPYGLEYVYSSANSAGVAAGNIIVTMVDGTYAPTNALHIPVDGTINAPVLHRSGVASTGAVTTDQCSINCAGMPASTDGITWDKAHNIMFGWDIYNATDVGCEIGTNGDGWTIINCKFRDCTLRGLRTSAFAYNGFIAYSHGIDNTSHGLEITGYQNTSRATMYRCYATGNGGIDLRIAGDVTNNGYGNMLGCIGVFDEAAWGGVNKEVLDVALGEGLFMDNTARLINGPPNNANYRRGISVSSGFGVALLNNQVDGFTNSGAGVGTGIYIDGATSAAIVGGNGYSDSETPKSGTIKADFDTSPNTADPSYPSTTDHTPAADMSGIALFETISTETNHIIPGAVDIGAGGSGSGISQGLHTIEAGVNA